MFTLTKHHQDVDMAGQAGAMKEVSPVMIDAGLAVLIDSGRLIEGEMLSDHLLVQQLYRAMIRAKLKL